MKQVKRSRMTTFQERLTIMIATETELHTVAAKALFLHERLQGKSDFSFITDQDHLKNMERTLQKESWWDGGKQAFRKRLAAETLPVPFPGNIRIGYEKLRCIAPDEIKSLLK